MNRPLSLAKEHLIRAFSDSKRFLLKAAGWHAGEKIAIPQHKISPPLSNHTTGKITSIIQSAHLLTEYEKTLPHPWEVDAFRLKGITLLQKYTNLSWSSCFDLLHAGVITTHATPEHFSLEQRVVTHPGQEILLCGTFVRDPLNPKRCTPHTFTCRGYERSAPFLDPVQYIGFSVPLLNAIKVSVQPGEAQFGTCLKGTDARKKSETNGHFALCEDFSRADDPSNHVLNPLTPAERLPLKQTALGRMLEHFRLRLALFRESSAFFLDCIEPLLHVFLEKERTLVSALIISLKKQPLGFLQLANLHRHALTLHNSEREKEILLSAPDQLKQGMPWKKRWYTLVMARAIRQRTLFDSILRQQERLKDTHLPTTREGLLEQIASDFQAEITIYTPQSLLSPLPS